MDKLTVEQTIRTSTYKPAAVVEQKQTTNLGGYAISFEELLQRVGARLDHAFSAADATSGFVNNRKDAAPKEDVRDSSSKRDSDSDRKPRSTARDDRSDDRTAAATNKPDADVRRDDTLSPTRDDNTSANNSDSRGDREHAARDTDTKSSQDDSGSRTSKNDAADNTGKNNGDDGANRQAGQGDDKTPDAVVGQGEVVQQAVVDQAATVLAAAIFNQNANTNSDAGDVDVDQQVGPVNAAAQGMAAQAATQVGRKGVHNKQDNTHLNGAAQKAAEAAAQQAAAAAAAGKPDAVKDQAAQLSRMIGSENRADVTVNVTDEKTQLTSKPSYTVTTDASLVAKERGADTHSGTQQQGGQQQNPNGQSAQQLQAAMQQQGQTAQPGQAAGTQQGGGVINAASANGGALSGAAQSSGASSVHAGGSESLGTAAQSTTTSQQSQQAREAAPQQQPQRSAALSGAVIDQISVKITKALQTGTDRISIHLKPSELGRVDVKLEMTHDGRVMTVVSAEKQDTLDLLRRDSSELQRALADAGLQSGDMEFNLQGQEKQTAEGENNGEDKSASNQVDVTAEDTAQNPDGDVLNAWESGIYFNGRLDMRA